MNWLNNNHSQNLKYIEDQVKSLKEKHPEAFPRKTETETKREIMDVLEEQLIILQNIQKILEDQQQTTKKFWNIF